MAFLSSFVRSFYAKALFVIIVGVVGITAGVKIGYTYFLTEKKITFAGPQSPAPVTLAFGPGDLFPWEPYVSQNNDTGNFEKLLAGKESVVLFLHTGCEACIDLLTLWKKEVRPELLSGVQEIACLPQSEMPVPNYYATLFKDMTVVFYDEKRWQKEYRMVLYPTLIGVDKNGFVIHDQYGFEGFIEFPIVNSFCLGRSRK